MIITYSRLTDPQANQQVEQVNADFVGIREKLQAGLQDTAALSDNQAHAQNLTALRGRPCPRTMVAPELAAQLQTISFGFKKNKDPADVYPLRAMEATGAQNSKFQIGLETESGDVVLGAPALNLMQFLEITELRTYYCTTRKSEGKTQDRYGTRLVAFLVIGRDQQNEAKYVYLAAASGTFSSTALAVPAVGQDPTQMITAVERAVSTFNAPRKNDYYMYWSINDTGLQLSAADGKGNHVINIRYSSFVGKTRSYLDNFSLISVVDIKNMISGMFENLEGLSFQIPFKKNPSGLSMTCTFGHGESRKNGTIDIFQKTKSKQYSIPQVGIGDLFTIGSPFSYTKQTMESHQTELAVTTEQADSVQLTVPAECYVANSFPATPLVDAVTIVQFSYFIGEYGMQLTSTKTNNDNVSTLKVLRKSGYIEVELVANPGNPVITVAGLGDRGDNDVYPGGANLGQFQDVQLPFRVAKRNGDLFVLRQVAGGSSCSYKFSYNDENEQLTSSQEATNEMYCECFYVSGNGFATASNYTISIPISTPAFLSSMDGAQAEINKALTETIIGFV